MRSALRRIRAVAARVAKPQHSPAEAAFRQPCIETIAPVTAPNASTMTQQRRLPPALFASGDLSPTQIARLAVIERDARVQRAALEAQFKAAHLIEQGMLSFIAEAVARASTSRDLASLDPEDVVRALGEVAADIDREIAMTAEEHATHKLAFRASHERHRPLNEAVSKRLGDCRCERDHLIKRIDALRTDVRDDPTQRYEAMLALGIKPEQIIALGVPQPATDNDAQIIAMRERVAALDDEISQLKAFNDDPFRNVSHLAGLDGFADLVAAQQAALTPGDAA